MDEYTFSVVRKLVNDNPAAQAAYQTLAPLGANIFLVGGAVRDLFLGKEPKDLDILVHNIPMETMVEALKFVGDVKEVGKSFGIILFSFGGEQVEIALPRVEQSTGEGHKDFDAHYHHTIPVDIDLGRRDFTANAMAIDLNALETGDFQNALIDPHNGQVDLANRSLRLVNPKALEDDPLRILRAIVAYARHGLMPDEDLQKALEENANKVRHLPEERIQMELDKLLGADDPVIAIEIAIETGVMDYILPEITQAMGFDQKNKYHDMPVGEHILQVLRNVSSQSTDIDLRLAALFHDIGKPGSFWEDEDGHGHFYYNPNYPESADHEDLGAEMAHEIMQRLKYPNDRTKRVMKIVQHHMWPYYKSEKGARKFLNNIGGDRQLAQDLFILRDADMRGKKGEPEIKDILNLEQSQALYNQVIQYSQATNISGLAINGNDLKALGCPQGPEIRTVLDRLVEAIIDDTTLNNREDLSLLAQQYINELNV